MDGQLKNELAEIEEEIENNNNEIQVILARQEQLNLQRQIIIEKLKNLENNVNRDCDLESREFPWSRKLNDTLKDVFKFDSLRPNQLQALNATLNGMDCILIMPTGGGKSLCFQLPAIISKGITVVVSPLISLMEDQVMSLKSIGVKAEMMSSSTDKGTISEIMKEMTNEGTRLKLLYVTPERLSKSKRFMSKLEKMYELGLFSRLAVDEVHCCSQWGHDFRKDYKILGIFKRQFSRVPIIGLTATATARVLLDVQEMLNIQNCIVFRASFNRANLFYKVIPKPSAQKEVLESLVDLMKNYKGQSGIIYCLTVKEAEDVSKQLASKNIQAMPYHAQLTPELRSKIHRLWSTSKIQVVVATIAFGMGIDKPDVRFVIHYSLTKSMENYYQESGRSGRDDKRADCIMFYRFGDLSRLSGMVFTESSGLTHLYSMAAYCIESVRCRRSMLADHFGERWEKTDCKNMCDICRKRSSLGTSLENLSKIDITSSCKTLHQIIDSAALSEQKLTGLKLIDAWMGKKVTGFVMPKVSFSKFSQLDCEDIIVYLLLEGYLKEHFHFTPYNTISYIIKGPKAAHVVSGTTKIEIQLKSSLTVRSLPKAAAAKETKTTKSIDISDNIKSKSVKSSVKDAKTSFKIPDIENARSKTSTSSSISEKRKTSHPKASSSKTMNNSLKDFESTDSNLDFGAFNSKKNGKNKKAKLNSDSDCELID